MPRFIRKRNGVIFRRRRRGLRPRQLAGTRLRRHRQFARVFGYGPIARVKRHIFRHDIDGKVPFARKILGAEPTGEHPPVFKHRIRRFIPDQPVLADLDGIVNFTVRHKGHGVLVVVFRRIVFAGRCTERRKQQTERGNQNEKQFLSSAKHG